MLIITADDYGKNKKTTDNILKCYSNNRITSASAMVFMQDSERAASSASGLGLEIGLHVNFTLPYTAHYASLKLREHQSRLVSYLSKYRLSQVIFNPLLTGTFNFVYLSQREEYLRLYSKLPDYYNGHHHMHLCANMLVSNLLPKGARIRGTFAFERGEKGVLNRLYRRFLNFYISKRFISTDAFFNVGLFQDPKRLNSIVDRAAKEDVEIEVHPENDGETGYLLSNQFEAIIRSVHTGSFLSLPTK